MGIPSDIRLLAMCLLSAVAGFVGYWALFPKYGGGVMFLLAVVTLALLMFVDGYVTATR